MCSSAYGDGSRGWGAGNTRSYVWMNSSPACLSAADTCVGTRTATLHTSLFYSIDSCLCLHIPHRPLYPIFWGMRSTAALRPLPRQLACEPRVTAFVKVTSPETLDLGSGVVFHTQAKKHRHLPAQQRVQQPGHRRNEPKLVAL